MNLYLLRHGDADRPNWQKSDAEKTLTGRGNEEIQKVALFLAQLDVAVEA